MFFDVKMYVILNLHIKNRPIKLNASIFIIGKIIKRSSKIAISIYHRVSGKNDQKTLNKFVHLLPHKMQFSSR